MQQVYIVSALRTPIGKFGGKVSHLSAVELASRVVEQAVKAAGLQFTDVDQVWLGLARQAGCGPNPARQVAVKAGLPNSVPAITVNQACASGLTAIHQAANGIALGEQEIVVAAGAEAMSRVPYLLEQARWGRKMGHQQLTDAMYRDGLHCPLCDLIMGETVQNIADEMGIGRQAQDDFALESHRKAAQAHAAGHFASERISIKELDCDEHLRPDASLADFSKLRPVFTAGGNVTAGNSSGITDGASCVVLASETAVVRLGLKPLARWEGALTVALEPARMALGPALAIPRLMERMGWNLDQVDRIEINEAFAAQVLACQASLQIPADRLNTKGGAIALGHPIGCSGNRLVVTLVHELQRCQGQRAVASLCVSGGMGIAAALSACH
jgi:acetyl-CoA C-acetyltransferase